MWHLKMIISEKWTLFWWSEHTFMGVSKENRWENVHFEGKPRHVTPQINRLGKMSTDLRVSTHIYGVSKEIDGKTFIFRVNLGMWSLKSIVLGKMSTILRVQNTFTKDLLLKRVTISSVVKAHKDRTSARSTHKGCSTRKTFSCEGNYLVLLLMEALCQNFLISIHTHIF